MRKVMASLMALMVVANLAGCAIRQKPKDKNSSSYVANEDRVTEGYKYDWIDYCDISVYGANGSAYIEVTPKEVKASDFESDADYIAIKAVLDELNLSYIAGGNNSASKLKVSPDSDLSAGDLVTFSITKTVDSKLSFNTQEYEFRIPTLSDANMLDLFSEDNVTFYALEGTGEIEYTFTDNSIFSEELKENLVYKISADTSVAEADKTILSISASLNSQFLQNTGYPSTEQYLSKYGYRADAYTVQKVLKEIASPINYQTVLKEKVVNALYNAVYNAEVTTSGSSNLNTICCVQQLEKDAADPFTQYVIYQDVNSNGDVYYYRRAFRAAYLNDQVIIVSMNNEESSKEEYATAPYTGGEIVLNNVVQEQAEEIVEETEETTEAEAEG